MQQLLGDAVQLDRFATLLITLFAVGGLITAAGGVYALLACTVEQRVVKLPCGWRSERRRGVSHGR